MAEVTRVGVPAGDWEAYYADDHLIEQTHRVDTMTVLRGLKGAGIDDVFDKEVTDEWAEATGHFPDSLSEIPEDAFA